MIDDDVDLVGSEFVSEARAVIEDTVAFSGESGADVLEDTGNDDVVCCIEQIKAEPGF